MASLWHPRLHISTTRTLLQHSNSQTLVDYGRDMAEQAKMSAAQTSNAQRRLQTALPIVVLVLCTAQVLRLLTGPVGLRQTLMGATTSVGPRCTHLLLVLANFGSEVLAAMVGVLASVLASMSDSTDTSVYEPAVAAVVSAALLFVVALLSWALIAAAEITAFKVSKPFLALHCATAVVGVAISVTFLVLGIMLVLMDADGSNSDNPGNATAINGTDVRKTILSDFRSQRQLQHRHRRWGATACGYSLLS